MERQRIWKADRPIDANESADVAHSAAGSKEVLYAFLRDHTIELLATIRLYAARLDFATGESARLASHEILQEVAVEALNHADRFDPQRQPMAWLLGIAVNIIRRKQTSMVRQQRREVSLSQLGSSLWRGATEHERPDDDDLLAALAPSIAGPEDDIEAGEQADELLALVAPEDRDVLHIAFIEGAERAVLAERLGITPGAASMRLHRALNRLRSAWLTHQRSEKGDTGDA